MKKMKRVRKKIKAGEVEEVGEGDKCPECGEGVLFWPKVEDCKCGGGRRKPCLACLNNKLTCSECSWEDKG